MYIGFIISFYFDWCTLPLPSIERFIQNHVHTITSKLSITEKWQRSILLCIFVSNEAIRCEWLLPLHMHIHTIFWMSNAVPTSARMFGKNTKNTHILMHTNTHKRRLLSEKNLTNYQKLTRGVFYTVAEHTKFHETHIALWVCMEWNRERISKKKEKSVHNTYIGIGATATQ